MSDDPFTAAEREIRAMVGSGWWTGSHPNARHNALAARTLSMPDGGLWVFGAGARWHRRHPSDGAWHLCPPPMAPVARGAAQRMTQGTPPAPIPGSVMPLGPEFGHDRGAFLGFVGPDCPREITDAVRTLLTAVMRRSAADFPTTWPLFDKEYPSTVSAVWGTIMWCAYAPVFDGNEPLLSMFGECLSTPLPGDEWVRWLPPLPLTTLLGLYGERLRAGRIDVALELIQAMVSTAEIVRSDPRFRPRADALLAMARPVPANPQIDYGWVGHGDPALVRSWLGRCPPILRSATLQESAPGEHFRHTVYDLAQTLPLGHTNSTGIVEPRVIAAALVAADVMAIRPDLIGHVAGWLEPEMRHVLHAVATQPAHPLRTFWPGQRGLPEPLKPPSENAAAAFLGASYATDLAWSRLLGGPVPPHGFPVPAAVVHHLINEQWAPIDH